MNNLDFGVVVDTAFHDLARWTENRGYTPPAPPLIETTPDGSAYVKNSLGLTQGGIQLPQVTVPVGVESGLGNTGTGTCTLAGTFTPFPATQLASLYPTHQDYVAKYTAAVKSAENAGYIEPYDGALLESAAQNSAIPATTYVP